MEKRITGIGVSPGIAIGKIYIFNPEKIELNKCPCKDPNQEKVKLLEARNKTKEQLEKNLKKFLKRKLVYLMLILLCLRMKIY